MQSQNNILFRHLYLNKYLHSLWNLIGSRTIQIAYKTGIALTLKITGCEYLKRHASISFGLWYKLDFILFFNCVLVSLASLIRDTHRGRFQIQTSWGTREICWVLLEPCRTSDVSIGRDNLVALLMQTPASITHHIFAFVSHSRSRSKAVSLFILCYIGLLMG